MHGIHTNSSDTAHQLPRVRVVDLRSLGTCVCRSWGKRPRRLGSSVRPLDRLSLRWASAFVPLSCDLFPVWVVFQLACLNRGPAQSKSGTAYRQCNMVHRHTYMIFKQFHKYIIIGAHIGFGTWIMKVARFDKTF